MSDKSALTPFQALNLEQRRKAMFLRAAGIVGIISGVILVVSGYITHPILLMMLSFIDEHYASSMSAMELYFLKLAISILTSLTALSGIVVICSGVVLLLKHRTFRRIMTWFGGLGGIVVIWSGVGVLLKQRSFGRILVWLGGGVGIFGLLFTAGEAFYYSHFSLASFHAEYWLGLVLSAVAIWLSKKG